MGAPIGNGSTLGLCGRCGGPALRADELVRLVEDDGEPQVDAEGRYCINGCHL